LVPVLNIFTTISMRKTESPSPGTYYTLMKHCTQWR